MIDANVTQMITGARLHRCTWTVDEPSRVLAFLPEGTRAHPDRRAFAIQYVVDRAAQTSGLGAHSATIVGVELDTLGPDGETPTRLITHVIASTPGARRLYAEAGARVAPGDTTVTMRHDLVNGETNVDGGALTVLRTGARVGAPTAYESAHHDFVIVPNGRPVISTQPWIATVANTWVPIVVEVPANADEIGAFRPAAQPQITSGVYSPNASWCVPALPYDRVAPHDDTPRGEPSYTY